MPLPLVHLGVARNLLEELKIKDKNYFYLGCIAPDAVHMRNNFCREDKNASHLYTGDKEICINNTIDFINKTNGDFFLGYGAHILTDIIWNKTIYANFKIKYKEDPLPLQSQTWAYYNDTDQLDFELFNKLSYRKEVWDCLSDSNGIDAENLVSANEINSWNTRTLHWYDTGASIHKNPIKYISYDDIVNFIKSTTILIKNLIVSDKLI